MLSERPLADLLAAFSSSAPTPGGGSASALSGALGTALLIMVASLPKTRTGQEEERARLDAARDPLLDLRDRLLALVDRDAEAYDQVVAAYRRPRGTDEERTARAAAIQRALAHATDVPLDVMRACREAAAHAATVADCGNPSAASDVGVALELIGAGLRGARLNVDINLESLKDAAQAARVREETAALVQASEEDHARVRARLGAR